MDNLSTTRASEKDAGRHHGYVPVLTTVLTIYTTASSILSITPDIPTGSLAFGAQAAMYISSPLGMCL